MAAEVAGGARAGDPPSSGAAVAPCAARWLAATTAAAPLATAALVALELAAVPVGAWGGRPATVALLASLLAHHAAWLLTAPLLYQSGLVLLLAWRLVALRRGTTPSRALGVIAASGLALAATTHAYVTLVRHEPLLKYATFVVAHAGLLAFLAAASWIALDPRRGPRLARWAPAILGCAGFAIAHAGNVLLFRGSFAALHLCGLEISLLLGMTGLSHALARLPPRAARPAFAVAGASAVAIAVGAAVGGSPAAREARPAMVAHALLGHAEVLVDPPGAVLPSWLADVRRDEPVERGTVASFQARCGLPPLPPDFALRDHDVLLVLTEATRFDQTSLADPTLRTTPSLERLRADGAWTFRQAHAPSSLTFQSVASLMAMLPASAVPMHPSEGWHGHVLPDTVTAAELLAEQGRATFWVGHDLNLSMTTKIMGLDQGFERVRTYPATRPGEALGVDEQVTDAALDEMERCWGEGRPFLGLVFYAGGHSDSFSRDYPARLPDWPAGTSLERYRQALRATDDQLARLLAAVARAGRLHRTVVIFTADHGEAFGEHGQRFHGFDLFDEVTHVPLVVIVPGLPGREVEQPVSLTHVLPWLMLSADGRAREAARVRVELVLDPLLRDTGGAVLMELFGPEVLLAALLHGDDKVVVDVRSEVPLVFDLAADPGERRPAFGQDARRDREALDRFRAYWRIRQRGDWPCGIPIGER